MSTSERRKVASCEAGEASPKRRTAAPCEAGEMNEAYCKAKQLGPYLE